MIGYPRRTLSFQRVQHQHIYLASTGVRVPRLFDIGALHVFHIFFGPVLWRRRVFAFID
jgi:hypothetical protein